MLEETRPRGGVETTDKRDPRTTDDQLIAIAYRSEPTNLLNRSELAKLLTLARERNASEGLSGLLIVGRRQIIQWLEGPAQNVDRVMGSIVRDPRHTNVSLIERHTIDQRLFGAWTMLLATENRFMRPQSVATILAPSPLLNPFQAGPGGLSGLIESEADALKAAVLSGTDGGTPPVLVLSDLAERLEKRLRGRNEDNWQLAAAALTTLLLEDDFPAVERFVQSMCRREADSLGTQISLFEQSERRLGDLWRDDLCSEADISVALVGMVRALRSVNAQALPYWPKDGTPPPVLVISQPGELHMLPAVLDAEVLWQRGWNPQLDFPNTNQELEDILARDWYGAVDISMSGVFRREERMPHLAETVARARRASKNKELAVTIGGRAARDDKSIMGLLDADGLVTTASEVETSITNAISVRNRVKRKIRP